MAMPIATVTRIMGAEKAQQIQDAWDRYLCDYDERLSTMRDHDLKCAWIMFYFAPLFAKKSKHTIRCGLALWNYGMN